jgi:hypothetical protein
MKYPAQTPIVVKNCGIEASVPRILGGEISVIYLPVTPSVFNLKGRREGLHY